jgi:hypothetical protein
MRAPLFGIKQKGSALDNAQKIERRRRMESRVIAGGPLGNTEDPTIGLDWISSFNSILKWLTLKLGSASKGRPTGVSKCHRLN